MPNKRIELVLQSCKLNSEHTITKEDECEDDSHLGCSSYNDYRKWIEAAVVTEIAAEVNEESEIPDTESWDVPEGKISPSLIKSIEREREGGL